MTLTSMNPFAMLLDSTAAIQAHEKVLSSLRKEVHKRADALPRHLQPEVIEFDTAIDNSTSGKSATGKPATPARKKPAARAAKAS